MTITPVSSFDDIYLLKPTDSIDASNPDPMTAAGIANRQAQQLANRTKWIVDNAPVNKTTIATESWPPIDLPVDFAPGHYSITSSNVNYRGGLVVFADTQETTFRAFQVLYKYTSTINSDGMYFRTVLGSDASPWFDIENANSIRGVNVEFTSPQDGHVLGFDGGVIKNLENDFNVISDIHLSLSQPYRDLRIRGTSNTITAAGRVISFGGSTDIYFDDMLAVVIDIAIEGLGGVLSLPLQTPKFYAIYVLKNMITNDVKGVLIPDDVGIALLDFGDYTQYKQIGYVKAIEDGGSPVLMPFLQVGNRVKLNSTILAAYNDLLKIGATSGTESFLLDNFFPALSANPHYCRTRSFDLLLYANGTSFEGSLTTVIKYEDFSNYYVHFVESTEANGRTSRNLYVHNILNVTDVGASLLVQTNSRGTSHVYADGFTLRI